MRIFQSILTDAQFQSALQPIVNAVTPIVTLPDTADQILSFQSRGTIPLFQMREHDVIHRQKQSLPIPEEISLYFHCGLRYLHLYGNNANTYVDVEYLQLLALFPLLYDEISTKR